MTSLKLDLTILVAYFAAMIGIGLAASRKQTSLHDYALGGRQMPWWAVLASILAAEISAATFLGAPGEGYELRNFTYAQLALGTILARLLVSWIFIQPYYHYGVVSIYEFLEKRFGPRSRQAASAIFLITRALASGTRLYVAAIVLVLGYEIYTGSHPEPMVELGIYLLALFVLVALTAVYTAAGGIKAVVWTDVIQACVMFSGLGFVLWHLLRSIPGGLPTIQGMLQRPGDLSFWNLGPYFPHDLWATLKGVFPTEPIRTWCNGCSQPKIPPKVAWLWSPLVWPTSLLSSPFLVSASFSGFIINRIRTLTCRSEMLTSLPITSSANSHPDFAAF
ncbi:MAG: hypothetical protein EBT69_02850 [Verrucomicrobia bacterium]|nr:hypothetical protein [Verrucomicrobiota bacterium]